MLSLPLYVFLFVYFAYLVVFAIFFLINLLHITHTKTFTMSSFAMTIFILGSAVLILFATWCMTSGVDWQQPVTVFNLGALSRFLPTSQNPF